MHFYRMNKVVLFAFSYISWLQCWDICHSKQWYMNYLHLIFQRPLLTQKWNFRVLFFFWCFIIFDSDFLLSLTLSYWNVGEKIPKSFTWVKISGTVIFHSNVDKQDDTPYLIITLKISSHPSNYTSNLNSFKITAKVSTALHSKYASSELLQHFDFVIFLFYSSFHFPS